MTTATRRATVLRTLPLLAIAALAAWAVVGYISESHPRYLTATPSVTQRFVSVPSENSLIDLCYRLRGVQGVTGVAYRDYAPADGSAMVTVFFNPRETSVRQVRIFMLHTKILWSTDMKV